MTLIGCALIGCDSASPLRPVQGTTIRVSASTSPDDAEAQLTIPTTEVACIEGTRVKPEELDRCLPYMDRSTGEIRLAFRPEIDGTPLPLALERDHIEVYHGGFWAQHGQSQVEIELIGHGAQRTDQLFIMLIDGSSSMTETDGTKWPRIERVRAALRSTEVLRSFFPGDGTRTGVVLLSFTEGTPRPVGGELKVIQDAREFRDLVDVKLGTGRGYTYLYDAVRYAVTDLLEEEVITQFIAQNDRAEPTIIVLTDGFNNESHADRCRDNAPRLEDLLGDIEGARPKRGNPWSRPSVYTVGLGVPLSQKLEADPEKIVVSEQDLCGNRGDEVIDGDLERRGIDKVSLDWIARVGGGTSYVHQDARGLGEAFRGAAAERYRWFELRYRNSPYFLRRSFDFTLRLSAFIDAQSSITFQPSGWLDAPPGPRAEGEAWSERPAFRRSSSFVMIILGALLGLAFLGAASFNARRAFSRRRGPPGR